MAEIWEAAERVQKNAEGQYRALIGGEWVPVTKAQKNTEGAFRVQRSTAVPNVRGDGEAFGRQLKLTGRAALEGVGDVADILTSPVTVPLEMLAGKRLFPPRSGKGVADALGLPAPETDEERLVNRGASAMAEAMVPVGLAAKGAKTASGATKEILQLLAASPGAQGILAALSGMSGEAVRQSGGDELEQAAAAMAAPLGASLAGHGAQVAGRTVKNIITAPFKGGSQKAAGRIATDVAGDAAPEIAFRLKTGAPPETAAQAAMPAGRAEFAGLERTVAGRRPSDFGPEGTIAKGAAEWQQQQRNALNASEEGIRSQLFSQADAVGLDVGNLSMEVARLKQTPGFKDETSTQILNWLDKEIVRRADTGTGGIAGTDLYDLRRDLGRKITAKMADEKKPWDKAKATALLREFQKNIDFEIESAIGSDRWTTELMQPSAQKRGELATIQGRVDEAARMGAAGAPEARRISKLDEEPFSLPNLLYRPTMALNALLRFTQGKGGERTAATLADLMQPHNKMGLARLMEEEIARRSGQSKLSDILSRSVVQGGLQASAAANSEGR